MERTTENRRVFLSTLAGGALLSTLLSTQFSGCRSLPVAGGERRRLRSPGPMLPPVPAVFLSVRGDSGPDELSVVWTFVLNGKPPQVGISVEHSHVAGPLITKHREFVLNVPSRALVKPFDVVDMNSSKVADKFAMAGLQRGRAVAVDAPTVAVAPIQVECRVTQELDLPPSRTVFFADVIATTVLPGVCDANDRLDVGTADVFGMTAGSGEFYTMGQKVGHIGQSVGRDDIRF